MENVIKVIKKSWPYLLGGALGGVAGYLYWYYIGCIGGSCPLKAIPMPSIILGALIGVYLGTLFNRRKK